ncbi:hypothetical protein HZB88_03735 [archaeon]|nr:hypothetical protein [archaeon]
MKIQIKLLASKACRQTAVFPVVSNTIAANPSSLAAERIAGAILQINLFHAFHFTIILREIVINHKIIILSKECS